MWLIPSDLTTLIPNCRLLGCFAITTVFSNAQSVVLCGSCSSVLCQPTGGKARLTEGMLLNCSAGKALTSLLQVVHSVGRTRYHYSLNFSHSRHASRFLSTFAQKFDMACYWVWIVIFLLAKSDLSFMYFLIGRRRNTSDPFSPTITSIVYHALRRLQANDRYHGCTRSEVARLPCHLLPWQDLEAVWHILNTTKSFFREIPNDKRLVQPFNTLESHCMSRMTFSFRFSIAFGLCSKQSTTCVTVSKISGSSSILPSFFINCRIILVTYRFCGLKAREAAHEPIDPHTRRFIWYVLIPPVSCMLATPHLPMHVIHIRLSDRT